MNSPHLSKNNGSTRDQRLPATHNNNIHTNNKSNSLVNLKFNQYYSIPIPSLSVKVPQFWHSRSTIVVVILVYIGFKWGGSSVPVQQ